MKAKSNSISMATNGPQFAVPERKTTLRFLYFDRNGRYTEFCTPYTGLHQVLVSDGAYQSQQRFGMYRWHITDPIRFKKDLRVTIQALGWRQDGRYLPLQDDIASVAFWYQKEPHTLFPSLPDRDGLEVI